MSVERPAEDVGPTPSPSHGPYPSHAARELWALLLTVVDLRRRLAEPSKEHGSGREDVARADRVGHTLLRLEQRMRQVERRYRIRPRDVPLDLGD